MQGSGSRHVADVHTYAWDFPEELVPAQRSRKYPLKFLSSTRKSGKNLMGTFYEELHCMLYGGRRTDVRQDHTTLDYVNARAQCAGEVRSCKVNSTTQLRASQLDNSERFQFEHPEWRVEFAIYRHRFQGIGSYDGSELDLARTLAKDTGYAVVIDLPVTLALYAAKGTSIAREYIPPQSVIGEPRKRFYERCAVIYSKKVKQLFTNPVSMLEELALDPSDFHIGKCWSPDDIKIQGSRVNQFPIVKISHKRYREWAEEFVDSYTPGRHREDSLKVYETIPF